MDVIRSQWRRGISASILSFIGKGVQPLALALGVFYARALETGEPMHVLDWELSTRSESSPNILLLTSIALLVMTAYASSTLCLYCARRLALGVRMEYSAHCTKHLLHLIETNVLGSSNPSVVRGLLKLANSNTIYCGRISYFFVLAAPEVLILLFAYAGLFLLEPMLTIGLTLVTSVACFFLYKTNVKASVASTQGQRLKKPATAAILSAIASRLDRNSHEEPFENPDWRRWLESTINPIRSVEDGALIFGFASAALLALIIIGLVAQIETEWARVVTYFIGFMVVATQLRSLSRRCVSINRFYPQAREYWDAVVNHNVLEIQDGRIDEEEDEEE